MANMASVMGFFSVMILLASLNASGGGVAGASRVFKVGGEFGWREPGANQSQVYSTWATRLRFKVGDSLEFVYRNDSVIQVEKWGYYHCNASQPIVAFNNGKSTFKLDRPGPFYYISGNLDHCKRGQRLLVEVMGYHHHHPPPHHSPPYVAAPPDQYPHQAPSPQPTSSAPATLLSSPSLLLPVVAFAAALF